MNEGFDVVAPRCAARASKQSVEQIPRAFRAERIDADLDLIPRSA
jgi:hypothetical protein